MNMSIEHPPSPRPTGRLIAGVIILGLGVVFLLDNFGVLDAGRIWDWWPVALIAIGVSHLLQRDPGRRGWGFLLVGIGGFFLLRNFHLVSWRWHDVWPFVLVLFGAHLVWRSLRRPRFPMAAAAAGVTGELNAFAVLGGGERVVRSLAFRGGEVTAVMGGFDVDLREAELAPEGARIEVFVVMGGVDFKVPENWNVVLKVTPILGGADFKARMPGPEAASGTLTISGVVLMGGVEVKN